MLQRQDVMNELDLGPNGALLYAMEYIEAPFSSLVALQLISWWLVICFCFSCCPSCFGCCFGCCFCCCFCCRCDCVCSCVLVLLVLLVLRVLLVLVLVFVLFPVLVRLCFFLFFFFFFYVFFLPFPFLLLFCQLFCLCFLLVVLLAVNVFLAVLVVAVASSCGGCICCGGSSHLSLICFWWLFHVAFFGCRTILDLQGKYILDKKFLDIARKQVDPRFYIKSYTLYLHLVSTQDKPFLGAFHIPNQAESQGDLQWIGESRLAYHQNKAGRGAIWPAWAAAKYPTQQQLVAFMVICYEAGHVLCRIFWQHKHETQL